MPTATEAEEPERVVAAVARLLHHGQQRTGGVPDADAGRVGPAREQLVERVRVHVGDEIGGERVAVVRLVALPHRRWVERDYHEPAVGQVPHHRIVPEPGR